MEFRFGQLLIAVALCVILGPGAAASVMLNGMFTSGAVLQRDLAIPVWGTADESEKVTVTLGGHRAAAVARQGKWSVTLPALPAGGPYTLAVSGRNRIALTNILAGDVFLCSGQSNMEWPLSLA